MCSQCVTLDPSFDPIMWNSAKVTWSVLTYVGHRRPKIGHIIPISWAPPSFAFPHGLGGGGPFLDLWAKQETVACSGGGTSPEWTPWPPARAFLQPVEPCSRLVCHVVDLPAPISHSLPICGPCKCYIRLEALPYPANASPTIVCFC